LTRLRAPAGLDLGSVEHEEIAVAILGELVALRATGGFTETVTVQEPDIAIDPVCEMEVDVATARFKTEYNGETYYFCAAGGPRACAANPEAFAGGCAGPDAGVAADLDGEAAGCHRRLPGEVRRRPPMPERARAGRLRRRLASSPQGGDHPRQHIARPDRGEL